MTDASPRAIPRLAVYGISTTLLTAGVVASAFAQHEYFYTACVQLAQSGAAMMVLANMGLLLTILLGKALVRVFFGRLRAAEVERLYEQGWLAVTETCLALAVLRDEFDAVTLTLFVFLLFCKVFHWLLEYRVGFMEQQARLSVVLVARMAVLSLLLAAVDCLMLAYAVSNTRQYGATMMIVFGFEYALLLVCFAATAAKFVLNAIDISRGGEWEDKATYVFYVDLADDLAKLIVYVGFFFTLTTYYGLPIHILRELYVTARSFVARCGDWVRYRKAMQNMHGRYPAVSQAELDTMSDATCIICREEMAGPTQAQADAWNQAAGAAAPVSGDTPKRLPCSHVFHFNCLRSWLERQQSCPTCRQSVLESEPRRAAGARDAPYGADQPPIDDPPAVSASSHQPDDLPVDSGSSVLDGASASAPSTTEPIQPPPLSSSSPPQQQHFRPKDNAGGTIESLAEQSLIPIFPNSTSLSAVHLPSLQEFPVPDLSTLSDEQIRRLDGDSRTAVEERIRILSAMQVQLSQMVVALTQVQSLHSGAPLKNRSSSPPAASKGKAPEI